MIIFTVYYNLHIRQINIKNWTACVQERVKWKKSLRRPKLSNEEVKRMMKEKIIIYGS
jgi:hypothetical protein